MIIGSLTGRTHRQMMTTNGNVIDSTVTISRQGARIQVGMHITMAYTYVGSPNFYFVRFDLFMTDRELFESIDTYSGYFMSIMSTRRQGCR